MMGLKLLSHMKAEGQENRTETNSNVCKTAQSKGWSSKDVFSGGLSKKDSQILINTKYLIGSICDSIDTNSAILTSHSTAADRQEQHFIATGGD